MSGIIDAQSPGQALAIVLGMVQLPDKMDKHTLLAAAAGVERGRLPMLDVEDFTQEVVGRYLDFVERRQKGEPVSHILGYRDFFEHRFKVTSQVLDPRPETEVLVQMALAQGFDRVLDLGTGSGAIMVSLLAARDGAQGIGTDLSEQALVVARENAEKIGVLHRCQLIRSDWFVAVDGRFDLIVSNPPYIGADEMPGLAPELRHEPRMALTDEADGLSAYRVIAAGAPGHLTSGGWLMVEIGPTQGAAVAEMFVQAGLVQVAVRPDLDGRDRVVIGQRPPE